MRKFKVLEQKNFGKENDWQLKHSTDPQEDPEKRP